MNALSSILYRDSSQKGGIRVRHWSILEFLTGPSCPQSFRVDLRQANVELSRYCLTIMMKELRFNICELETSCLPNSKIKDLANRVQRNISDALQYGCFHWSSHLCFDLVPTTKEVSELLNTFFTSEIPLYWLEVLSIMGNTPATITALRQIKECNNVRINRLKYCGLISVSSTEIWKTDPRWIRGCIAPGISLLNAHLNKCPTYLSLRIPLCPAGIRHVETRL